MRVPINLASRPYENLRPYQTVAALAAVLLLALTARVAWKEWQNRNETRLLTEQTRQIQRETESLLAEQRELEQWLNRSEVQEIAERSAFLNSLILRKSLSWTQMFMDIEKILPNRAQVTSIRPQLNRSRQLELQITVASLEIGPLVEFLKKLESDPRFGSPVVHSQTPPAERSQDRNTVVELSARYYQGALPEEPQGESPPEDAEEDASTETAAGLRAQSVTGGKP